ncbi:MAG: prefoldin subunit [Candidatus Marsarchaeota archaeon]|jgi:prefoldin beta subunit|nr:prefoldin subunit [Candidatus Marsarchaeota archaeon]MCL5115245.1 prefoldin subunit [Candidatus Marsarchaeota archaeon]
MSKEQLEKLTSEYQILQEQLQSLAIQKAQFSEQNEELKEALAEVDKATGKIYSTIGGVMIETSKTEATKVIKEKMDTVQLRLSLLTKQYDEAAKKEKTLRSEIEAIIKQENPIK